MFNYFYKQHGISLMYITFENESHENESLEKTLGVRDVYSVLT